MKHGSLAEERSDLVRQWSTSNELSPNEVTKRFFGTARMVIPGQLPFRIEPFPAAIALIANTELFCPDLRILRHSDLILGDHGLRRTISSQIKCL